jgi:hypothetical protein
LDKLLPLSSEKKLKFYLDIEWIFDRMAHERSFRVYDSFTHPIRQFTLAFLTRHLKLTDSVFDLGCSNGSLTMQIASKVTELIGVDHNERLIKQAKLRNTHSNVTFVCDDAHNYLRQNNKVFDVLILSHILEHLDDPFSFLSAYKDFFSFIYIEVPDSERNYLNLYRERLRQDLIYSDNDHVWEFDRMGIIELLQRANIIIEDSEFRMGVQRYWCRVKSIESPVV